MWQEAMTFTEFVSTYNLARSEGLVLRYLADAYKALRVGVPPACRTEEVLEITEWLGEMVRQVDSSLLDEWEALVHPEDQGSRSAGSGNSVRPASEPRPVTTNERAFRVMVRNALFRRVELLARHRYDELGTLDADAGWDAQKWEAAGGAYFAEHDELDTGADARGPHMLLTTVEPGRWVMRQILADPAGDHDWGISAVVDLAASDEAGEAVVEVTDVNRL